MKSDGLILTNAHVVEGATRVTVTLQNGEKYEGTVENYNTTSDLATVRIKAVSYIRFSIVEFLCHTWFMGFGITYTTFIESVEGCLGGSYVGKN